MLLQWADAVLLTCITLPLGILTRELLVRLFRVPLHTDLLELFLLGLLFSSFYFNILSFWFPVNYWSLLPLIVAGPAIALFYHRQMRAVSQSIWRNLAFAFSSSHRWVTIVVGLVLLVYSILPCSIIDSIVYHYPSILWYEKYKVVPGLANLNARLAFNPASFVIESAYAFTGPVGQSLYPLNSVAVLFLFAWLLVRILRAGRSLPALLYTLLLILAYHRILCMVSSPTSDGLSMVCMLYVFVRLAEYCRSADKSFASILLPVLVILYGLTLKVATFELLLALPYLFFGLPRLQRKLASVGKIAFIGLLIGLPWIGRNYILSGYFVFPVSFTGWLHPDWQPPGDVLKMELNYIHLYPRITDDWSATAVARARTPLGWLMPWFRDRLSWRPSEIVMLCLALLSPFYWLIRHGLIRPRHKKGLPAYFLPWAIAFSATLIWLETSPAFRFGAIYIYMAILFPAFDLAEIVTANQPLRRPDPLHRFYPTLIVFSLTLFGCYYVITGFRLPTTYAFSLGDCWLTPLKPIWFNDREKLDFPYRTLPNGTRLYIKDANHQCINTCLPCVEFNYGEIEMRGTRLDQGFRNVRDEVRLHYPMIVQ